MNLRGATTTLTLTGSKNGTFVNGLAIVEAYLAGDENIRLGATLLRVARGQDVRQPDVADDLNFGRTIGMSLEMRRLYPVCKRLASADVPVIIEGETGTGKEVLAESLHEEGPRASGPFIVFDCTAVAPSLVESELFGHERGAFTGAVATRKSVFEQADGGTLLIDEIGDLDISLQPKLLRALERREVRRVGGDRWFNVDVRVLAATRRDLDRDVQAGRFRDDLYHRLAVGRIELPPLRARRGDVPLLAHHFATREGASGDALPHALLARWEDYPWPGNVRELRNAVARFLSLGEDGPGASASKLPPGTAGDAIEQVLALDLPLIAGRERVVREYELRYIERLLAKHGGSVAQAASASGVARRHFNRLKARAKR
jgi:DNA-binding NtrC family response regulator